MKRRNWMLLWALSAMMAGSFGCGNRNSDQSDPDPNYYKGKNFHAKGGPKTAEPTGKAG